MASMGRISKTRGGNEGKGLGQMLGALSIGLGVLDLLAARRIARFLGIRGSEGLIRACGLREVVTGLGLIGSRNRTPWILSRVGGDVMDVAGLSAGLRKGNKQKRNIGIALAAVGALTALDLLYARSLSRAKGRRGATEEEFGTAGAAEQEMEILHGEAPRKRLRASRRRSRRRQAQEFKAAA